ARSQFHHSANYRSVVMHGVATPVVDEPTRRKVLAALVDKVAPGRSAETRPPTAKELAGSGVLAIPLVEVSVKARDNDVVDDPADLTLPYRAGLVPPPLAEGRPEPDRHAAV